MKNLEVAKTILEQLGGNRFAMMTGSKGFVGSENSLSFRVGKNAKGINAVHIELTPADTYTVTFKRIRGHEAKEVGKVEDVYFDMLQEVFTRATGMYTRL